MTIEKRLTQKEFLGILKRAVREGDTRETALSKANDILQLQPSFMGIGLNLNALIDKLLRTRKKRQAAN